MNSREEKIAPVFAIESQLGVSSSSKKQQYLQQLGSSLAETMELPEDVVLRIHHSDSEEVNAFASLNGLIVINQGLIDFVESENELAFILAHEIAHIKERHPIKSLSSGVIVGLLVAMMTGGSDNGGAASTLSTGVTLTSLGFSRANESDADTLALQAIQHYYGHTAGSTAFFTRLHAKQHLPEILTFISTHPGHEERIASLNTQAEKMAVRSQGQYVSLPDFMQN